MANLKALERYPYCGHGVILGAIKNEWQDRESVFAQFGSREGDAKEAYRRIDPIGWEAGLGLDIGSFKDVDEELFQLVNSVLFGSHIVGLLTLKIQNSSDRVTRRLLA